MKATFQEHVGAMPTQGGLRRGQRLSWEAKTRLKMQSLGCFTDYMYAHCTHKLKVRSTPKRKDEIVADLLERGVPCQTKGRSLEDKETMRCLRDGRIRKTQQIKEES